MARIVFIDDDRKVHELVCTALEQHGYHVSRNWDSTILCVPREAVEHRSAAHSRFLLALMHAFAAWST